MRLAKLFILWRKIKKNISKKINLILFKDFGKIKIDFQKNINQLKKFLILELDK